MAVSINRSDMDRWMAAFPNTTNQERDDKEVIYEDWGEDKRIQNSHTSRVIGVIRVYNYMCLWMADCPQVQCVEQYIAQQADELNLEPTEIINVIRKTNEGKSILWERFIFRKQAAAAETETEH